jgi:hypothetical protein
MGGGPQAPILGFDFFELVALGLQDLPFQVPLEAHPLEGREWRPLDHQHLARFDPIGRHGYRLKARVFTGTAGAYLGFIRTTSTANRQAPVVTVPMIFM